GPRRRERCRRLCRRIETDLPTVMTSPASFPQLPDRPAVLPFPEGEGMPHGRTSAHASYRWTGLLPAHLPTRPRPTTITRFTAIFGAEVPWILDDKSQFQSNATCQAI